MTKYEIKGSRMIITSEGGVVYSLIINSSGVTISYGEDGSGGTIYESTHVNLTIISKDILEDILFTFIEAAVTAVDDYLITDFYDQDEILNRRIGVSRFNQYSDVIREYIRSRVHYW